MGWGGAGRGEGWAATSSHRLKLPQFVRGRRNAGIDRELHASAWAQRRSRNGSSAHLGSGQPGLVELHHFGGDLLRVVCCHALRAAH